MRADAFAFAWLWATRSQRLRRQGRHDLRDSELAHLFGAEWGLDAGERGRLLAMLMRAEAKAA